MECQTPSLTRDSRNPRSSVTARRERRRQRLRPRRAARLLGSGTAGAGPTPEPISVAGRKPKAKCEFSTVLGMKRYGSTNVSNVLLLRYLSGGLREFDGRLS